MLSKTFLSRLAEQLGLPLPKLLVTLKGKACLDLGGQKFTLNTNIITCYSIFKNVLKTHTSKSRMLLNLIFQML
jgi:hypothetical protein